MTNKEFNEYRRQRRARLKAQGLCVDCAKRPSEKGIAVCRECADKRNKRDKELRKAYSDYGICPRCGKNSLWGDEKNCIECRTIYSARAINSRDREHYNRTHSDWSRKTHKARIEQGVCTRCGKTKATVGYKTCAVCRMKIAEIKRRNSPVVMSKEDRYKNGLCFWCDNPRLEKYKVCQVHYDMCVEKSHKADRTKIPKIIYGRSLVSEAVTIN